MSELAINISSAVEAMGTRFEVVLHGADEVHLHAVADEVLDEVRLWDHRLSAHRRDSVVSDINANAHRGPVHVDQETFDALAHCARLHADTLGLFDPAIGSLMRRWGFRDTPPLEGSAHGMSMIELDDERLAVRFVKPGVELDLGAVGKGIAIDRAVEIMRDHGIGVGFIHGGTSCAAGIGTPPNADSWRVRVAVPGGGGPVVELRDCAVGVSAQHGRVSRHEGRDVGHVIDPTTELPVERTAVSVVIAESATDADAWSTALLVAGERPPAMPAEMTAILCSPNEDHGVRPGTA